MAKVFLPRNLQPGFTQPGIKPTVPAIIDESNWASIRRLFYAPILDLQGDQICLFHKDHDLTSGIGTPNPMYFMTPDGGTDYSFDGRYLKLNQSGNDTRFRTTAGVKDLANDLSKTYFVRVKTGDFVAQGSSLNTIFDFGGIAVTALTITSTENIEAWVDTINFGGGINASTKFRTYAIVVDTPADEARFYVDGLLQATQAITTPLTESSASFLQIGGESTRNLTLELEFFGVLLGACTQSEIQNLTNDPYQMLKPAMPVSYDTADGAAPTGRIMSSLAYKGGLAGSGGIAGSGGGLCG